MSCRKLALALNSVPVAARLYPFCVSVSIVKTRTDSLDLRSLSQENHRVKLRLQYAEKRIRNLETKYPPALRDY